MNGGLGIVEILNKSNILALVGGGYSPKYEPNKVIIYDDELAAVFAEFRFETNIRSIKLACNNMYVVLDTKIFIIDIIKLENCGSVDTYPNENGLVAVSHNPDNIVLAFPYTEQGYLWVKFIVEEGSDIKKKPLKIHAHTGTIACLSMNQTGTFCATASDKGTLIRIFSLSDGSLFQELRRGTSDALIYNIAFDLNDRYISCTSDKGTIHIFFIKQDDEEESEGKMQNKTGIMGKIFGKVGVKDERSFAQFRIGENKSICAFSGSNHIVAVAASGNYYLGMMDLKKGGECKKISKQKINIDVGNVGI